MSAAPSQPTPAVRSVDEHSASLPRQRAVLLLRVESTGSAGEAELAAARASALEASLPEGWAVFSAIHRGEPNIATALESIEDAGFEDLVVVCDHPYFSRHTTRMALRELYRLLSHLRTPLNVTIRADWYDDIAFVNAQAALLAKHAADHGLSPADTYLSFWARRPTGGPGDCSDPYYAQVRRSAELVAERLGWPPRMVSLRFLENDVTAERLTFRKVTGRAILACPLFALLEREQLVTAVCGSSDPTLSVPRDAIYVCAPLPGEEAFVGALRDIVLRGSRPAPHVGHSAAPLLTPERHARVESCPCQDLFMVGVSLASPMESMRLSTRASDPSAFAAVKQPRLVRRRLLERVRDRSELAEAFVWDTCQRIEFYGWTEEGIDGPSTDRLMEDIRCELFGNERDGLYVEHLVGRDALHHLLRATCGLESRLPGDMDVAEQLRTACRIAQCVGAAGARAQALTEWAVEAAEAARKETRWGRFSAGYCAAALSGVFSDRADIVTRGRHVIVGGSTTSRSVLRALSERFHVPQDQLTVVYRDHHGQMKLLRKAVGSGTRLRVHSYTEPVVLRAVADADFVFFGVDQVEQIMDMRALAELRDFAARPLTLVDFNSFGSIRENSAITGVTLLDSTRLDGAVAAHAAVTVSAPGFAAAVESAEAWIAERAGVPDSVPQPAR